MTLLVIVCFYLNSVCLILGGTIMWHFCTSDPLTVWCTGITFFVAAFFALWATGLLIGYVRRKRRRRRRMAEQSALLGKKQFKGVTYGKGKTYGQTENVGKGQDKLEGVRIVRIKAPGGAVAKPAKNRGKK